MLCFYRGKSLYLQRVWPNIIDCNLKNIMRKTLTTLLLVLLSVSLYAGEKKVLSVLMTDGTNVCFYLSEQPLVTFVGEDVKITSVSEEAVVARTLVERFEFLEAMPTHIEKVEMDEGEMVKECFDFSEEAVKISGLATDGKVNVFTLKGQVVASAMPDGEGNVTVAIESLPAGLYLINYNETTIKFIKR